MASSLTHKNVEVRCYCGAMHLVFRIPAESLPLETHLCHCSKCRYCVGSLARFAALLPVGLKPEFVAPSSRDNLTTYNFNASRDRAVAVFCSTCGSHVACHTLPGMAIPETWALSTSSIVPPRGREDGGARLTELYRMVRHIFAASAKDGGLADILKTVGDRELALIEPDASAAEPVECELGAGDDGQEMLKAECACRGVSFDIPRPDQVHDRVHVHGKEATSVSVSANPNKWRAHFDAGDEARLMTGTHVQSWAQTPLSAITPAVGPEFALGTLRRFVTAEGNAWAYCRVCGASVFRLREEDGQGVVSVSVGVLRAPEGPLAEEWLEWQPAVEFEEEGNRFDAEFMKGFVEGLRAHRICA